MSRAHFAFLLLYVLGFGKYLRANARLLGRRSMPYDNRTYRIQDGEHIDGSWRHLFIKNGSTYFLTDLKVYGDGMIDCWGLVDLATFQRKVASGWVATTFQQGAGAKANVHHLASWRFDRPHAWVTPQQLIAEVSMRSTVWRAAQLQTSAVEPPLIATSMNLATST
jgi:hypothetical protein